jgi:uncharacterized protein (DUF302 family)
MNYGISKTVDIPFEHAVEKVTGELKKEGFGVLTEINVKDILKKKLDLDFRRYVILGACNPQFAHKALTADENIGLLLPCNVIVYESGNCATVAAFNPMAMMALVENSEIESVAAEVKTRLQRVIDAV